MSEYDEFDRVLGTDNDNVRVPDDANDLSLESHDYYTRDIDKIGYHRLVKNVQQSGEWAVLHGTDLEDHFCMDFDCEIYNAPPEGDD